MTIYTNIIINGSIISSFNSCDVTRSLSNEYSSNEFSASIDNYMGRNGSRFQIGDGATIYIEKDHKIMSEDIRNDLIGYWKLDENLTWASNLGIEYSQLNDVRDSTGNFPDADNYYTFVESGGKINNCLGFTMSEESQVHVIVDPTDINQNPTDFSFSFWNKYDSSTVQDSLYPISTLYTSSTSNIAYDYHGVSLTSSSGNVTSKRGIKILTKSDFKIFEAIKNSSVTATTCYLLASNGSTVLATATFTGDVATLNYNLSNATVYYLVADSNGGTYNYQQSSVHGNVEGTYVTFQQGYEAPGDVTVYENFTGFSVDLGEVQNTYRNWAFFKGTVPSNNISFYTYGPGSVNGTFIGSVGVSSDTWNHYVGTLAGSLAKFYHNGTLVGSLTPITRSTLVDTMHFGTGSVYSGIDGYYWLDEIGLFNRAITDDEVLNLYNNGSGIAYGKNIFNGLVEDIKYTGVEKKEEIQLNGRDWTLALQDRTVEPEVYTNITAGSIVRDIILKYTDEITTNGVMDSPQIIDRIAFNHTPVFDAIKQLADYTQFVYYVDENKDLKFHEKKSINSTYVYDNTNTNTSTKISFKDQRDTIYNQVWVYGDRYLDGYKETFIANGGSVFTLFYNPHNTNVTVGGSVIQPGQIQGISITPVSGAKYEVDFDDKTITFVSGTTLGNYTPTSGNQVIVTYDRSLPIVKTGENQSSITQYGRRVKVIQDKNIKDPATAELVMLQNLEDFSDPLKQGTISIKGLDDVGVGQSVLVNNTFHNVIYTPYDVAEIKYNLTEDNCLSEEVMTLKLNKKLPDITDKLKEVILELKKIQGIDISTSDIITRYQFITGSEGIRQSGAQLWSRDIYDTFILDHSTNGILGTLDSSATGSVISGANWTTGRNGSYCLLFNGSTSQVKLPEYIGSYIAPNASERTISAWIMYNGSSFSPSGGDACIIGGRYGDNTAITINSNKNIHYQTDDSAINSSPVSIVGSPNWEHIVLTDSLSPGSPYYHNVNIYLNGSNVKAGSYVHLTGNPSSQPQTYIGYESRRVFAFNGKIDDLKIYNRILNGSEVVNLYNDMTINGSLVAQYRMWEGSGNTTYSSALNGSSVVQTFLGDRRGPSGIIWSGGYF